MAQNNKISVSLSNPIEILNKAQSMDGAYGVYDNESDALIKMNKYGLDGRLVAVYVDKPNGICRVYKYNAVHHRLDPITDPTGTIGGRNFVRYSGTERTINNNARILYPTEYIPSEHNDNVVITIWGTLAAGKTGFRISDEGATEILGVATQVSTGKYQWKGQVTASIMGGHIAIEQFPLTGTGTSTIQKIQLEIGENGTDWRLAQEDIIKMITDLPSAHVPGAVNPIEYYTIHLHNPMGIFDTSTEPTMSDINYSINPSMVLGGFTTRLIRTFPIDGYDFPVVTGAELVEGSPYEKNTDYWMTVINRGNRVEYWFEKTKKFD